jgi:predicted RNase H-like HicB family nuclease
MTLALKIHLEAVGEPDDGGFVWWAESDDLPGFTAAADHLPDLLAQSADAIREITGDENVEIVPQLVFDDEAEPRVNPASSETSEPQTPIRQVVEVNRVLEPA